MKGQKVNKNGNSQVPNLCFKEIYYTVLMCQIFVYGNVTHMPGPWGIHTVPSHGPPKLTVPPKYGAQVVQ